MWCGHAASALNPVIEAVTDNKCLDILAQSAGQCKCFLILFFAAQTILYINIIYKSIVCVSSVHDRLILYRIYRQKSNR